MLAFLSEWASLIVLGIQPMFAWVIWSIKQSFVSKSEFSEMERRVSNAENCIKGLPTNSLVNQVLLKLEELRGDLRAMREKAEGQDRAIARVERGVDQIQSRGKEQ